MNQNDRREKISEIIGNIDEKYLCEAEKAASKGFSEDSGTKSRKAAKPLKLPFRKGWVIAAAAVLVLLIGGASAFMISSEAKEYNQAVVFFEENDLPMDGLTRAEVKEVYRDITKRTFTSRKTEEVIRARMAGLEILQEEPTPEELAAVWDRNPWDKTIKKNGDSYRIREEEKRSEIGTYLDFRGIEITSYSTGFDKSVVEFYHDAELVWSADITKFYAEDCLLTSAGTIVWGRKYIISKDATRTRAWMARIDETGQVVWQKPIMHGFDNEAVITVLDDGNGLFTLVTQGDRKLCVSQFDSDANELDSFRSELQKEYGAAAVVRLQDGYLIQLQKWNDQCLVRMDADGTMHEPFRIEGEDCDYFISDMAEFEGKIYLSARAVPPAEAGKKYRNDLSAVLLDLMFRQDAREMTSEELTPMIRDNYTAVLLICDPDGGMPETFYSVEGCLGGALHVRGTGTLEWEVQSVTSSEYVVRSAYTIDGLAKIWQYTFDENGELLKQEDTGNTETFRR